MSKIPVVLENAITIVFTKAKREIFWLEKGIPIIFQHYGNFDEMFKQIKKRQIAFKQKALTHHVNLIVDIEVLGEKYKKYTSDEFLHIHVIDTSKEDVIQVLQPKHVYDYAKSVEQAHAHLNLN